MTTIRHSDKANTLQVALRNAAFDLLGEQPGLTFHEIHVELMDVEGLGDCTVNQLRAAMEWLRDHDYTANDGALHPQYFRTDDAFSRNSIPAIGAKPLKCNVMPEAKCNPVAWSAFMLLNGGVNTPLVANKRKANQEHHRAIISDATVAKMRALYIPGKYGYGRIAKEFGCPDSTVRDIIRQKTRVAA